MLDPASTEYKIAIELRRNCRAKIVDLANTIGVTRQTIATKIQEMENSGIIEGYQTIIDPAAFGLGILTIIGITIDSGSGDRVLEQLAAIDQIHTITIMAGREDILCYAAFPDTENLYATLQNKIGAIPEIDKIKTRFILKEHWKVGFFNGKTFESPTGFGFQLSQIDKKILRMIQKNARMPLSGIAKQLGVSEQTIGKHLSNMERQNIIRQYRAQIAPFQVGLNVSATIEVKLSSPKRFKMVDQILQLQGTTVINEVTGEMDLHVNVSLPSMNELRSFLHDQLAQLPGILDVVTSVILKQYRKFPM